jgi:pyruvate/2-oxoglutarate dehydrogenase complex dihydrolipoamide acyltransferase (E2) component
MNQQVGGYMMKPFPKARQMIVDVLELGRRKHFIHGLVEVDVTQARRLIHEYKKQTGNNLSFSAFIIACLGKAVGMNKHMQAYRANRNRLIIFDDVDVSTQIEIEMDGRKFPIPHTIKAADKRNIHNIHHEIRKVKSEGARSSSAPTKGSRKLVMNLPTLIRRPLIRLFFNNPHRAKQLSGTVMLTSIGMFGSGGGWGIPYIQHTLGITLGGIAKKPVVIADQIEVRECLSMTISFNHDIIDGAPAARFTKRFTDLIESGYGLSDLLATTASP